MRLLSNNKWSRRTKVLTTACMCILLAVVLQVTIGFWFVLGLPLLLLIILLPVCCVLYVYKSRVLLWLVVITVLAGSVLFVEVNATSQMFGDICHDLKQQYQSEGGYFSSDGQLICNYYHEDTISAPAISSAIGKVAFMTIAVALAVNILQVSFALYRLLSRRLQR